MNIQVTSVSKKEQKLSEVPAAIFVITPEDISRSGQEFGTVQYGGKINEDTDYRVFTKYQNNNHFPDLNGQNGDDDWHLLHGGFRVDTILPKKNSLTIQGDLYTGNEGATIIHSILSPPDNVSVDRLTGLSGGNILARWDHAFSDRSDTTLQLYFDRYERSGPESNESRSTFDLDFQHHFFFGQAAGFHLGPGFPLHRRSDRGYHRPVFRSCKFLRSILQFFYPGSNPSREPSLLNHTRVHPEGKAEVIQG